MRKIKYLMPCISLPLIAAPAITMVSCSTKTEEKKEEEKFTGKVTEAEFISGVGEIMDPQSRKYAQATGSGRWIEEQFTLKGTLDFVVDHKDMIVKLGSLVAMGESYDEESDSLCQVINAKILQLSDKDMMITEEVLTPYTSVATIIPELVYMCKHFDELEFEDGAYYEKWSDGYCMVKFNKDKKLVHYKTVDTDPEEGEDPNLLTLDFTYNNIPMTDEEKEVLKPINVHKPNYIGDGVVTFDQHTIYPSIPNYYMLGDIQFNESTETEVLRTDIKPLEGPALNFDKATVFLRHICDDEELEEYDNCFDIDSTSEGKMTLKWDKDKIKYASAKKQNSILGFTISGYNPIEDAKILFGYDDVIEPK